MHVLLILANIRVSKINSQRNITLYRVTQNGNMYKFHQRIQTMLLVLIEKHRIKHIKLAVKRIEMKLNSLEELDIANFPSRNFQWRASNGSRGNCGGHSEIPSNAGNESLRLSDCIAPIDCMFNAAMHPRCSSSSLSIQIPNDPLVVSLYALSASIAVLLVAYRNARSFGMRLSRFFTHER